MLLLPTWNCNNAFNSFGTLSLKKQVCLATALIGAALVGVIGPALVGVTSSVLRNFHEQHIVLGLYCQMVEKLHIWKHATSNFCVHSCPLLVPPSTTTVQYVVFLFVFFVTVFVHFGTSNAKMYSVPQDGGKLVTKQDMFNLVEKLVMITRVGAKESLAAVSCFNNATVRIIFKE